MSSATLAAATSGTVRFRRAGGAQPLILVPVRVNDHGPFEFILDTGAGTSLLAPELANSLAVKSIGSKQGHTAGGAVDVLLANVDSIALGDVRRENIDVGITDLSMIGRAVGAQLDGDLGYNFLKHFRLSLDFHALELRVHDPCRVEQFGPPRGTELSMRLAHPSKPLILIETFVSDRGPFQFAIDTGTSTTAISPELARALHLQPFPFGAATTGGAQIQLTAAQVPSLRVGRAELRDVHVVIGEFLAMLSTVAGAKLDGIVGYNFLRNYKVVIDYPNESFRLE
ncbi:MAG: retroviral-like aspartic protease family protein [Verrucomicrobiota bacterium]|nr:retroviral-like aspartic protease family protein [Verrucomicrobiota bacterium]